MGKRLEEAVAIARSLERELELSFTEPPERNASRGGGGIPEERSGAHCSPGLACRTEPPALPLPLWGSLSWAVLSAASETADDPSARLSPEALPPLAALLSNLVFGHTWESG